MNPIIVTDSACKAFLENLQSDGSESKYIRVAVRGGGCQGLIYYLDIDDKIDQEDDFVFEKNSLKFVIDVYSSEFLKGTTIDYSENLNESGFKFINELKRSCGCGKSFSF